jgi:tellurite resistance protein
MFDAEKLLGKIVGEVLGQGGKSHGGGKSMLGSLASGSGLMTIIGLGVGAFEILKQQGQDDKSRGSGQAPPPPPGSAPVGAGTPPPVPGGVQAAPPPPPLPGGTPVVSPPAESSRPVANGLSSKELAVRLIQIMVAAAHADGTMDQGEERIVLDKMRGADLSQEEKMFLLEELHRPQSIEALTAGISDPSVIKTMYMLAVAVVEIDTEAERSWLDQLARRLGLSRDMQAFIEEQR